MKKLTFALLLSLCAYAQSTPAPTFPAIPIPVGIAAFGEFNQLGSPRTTMGVSAISRVSGPAGVYGTTTADISPQKSVDPGSGKTFWAIQTGIRQGLHKD